MKPPDIIRINEEEKLPATVFSSEILEISKVPPQKQ
jgi:hypothetical protein